MKPFHESKSRLAPVLDAHQRAALSRQLLEEVIARSRHSGLFAEILVISRDAAALAIAQAHGARILRETGAPVASSHPARHPEATLNHALYAGRQHALAGSAQAILVLPADLPLLTAQDLTALTAPLAANPHAQTPESRAQVVLAPSHDGGTNALLLRPPTVIDFAFGPQSFSRHRALAQAANAAVTIVHTPSLTYDLDLPEDLWGEELGI